MGKPTQRYSLKTISTHLSASVFKVYLHGTWQKSRGRKPSMPLYGMRNPNTAFLFAKEMVGDEIEELRRTPNSRTDLEVWR